MPKASKKNQLKIPVLVKIIAVLLIFLALSVLAMVFTSLYFHFISGYPMPKDVSWATNLLFLFVVSVILIFIAAGLFLRKKYARILAIISLFIISVLNLKAEILVFSFPQSLMTMVFNTLFFLSALYLLFSKKVRTVFS